MIIRVIICLLCILFFQVEGAEGSNFVLITIPKSGTHMMIKLLDKMTKRKRNNIGNCDFFAKDDHNTFFDQQQVLEALKQIPVSHKRYFHAHFNRANLMEAFIKKHPRYKKIILIRDLRDVLVSYVHWLTYHPLSVDLGMPEDLSERLMWVIKGVDHPLYEDSTANMYRHALYALQWMRDPEVLVVRFEELCGAKGGGSDQKQREVIKKIASHLKISLSKKRCEEIMKNLWGEKERTLEKRKGSFRKGKKGGWRELFSKEHEEAFQDRYGELLIQMEYCE